MTGTDGTSATMNVLSVTDEELPMELDADLLTEAQAVIDAEADPDPAGDYSPAATISPFALQDDHEFPSQPSVITSIADKQAATLAQSQSHSQLQSLATTNPAPSPVPAPAAAFPGTPDSAYRHCACIAVLPGRVCPICQGSKWTRICPECEGEGRSQNKLMRGRLDRSQPCGFCGTKGLLPALPKEIQQAEQAAREAEAARMVQESEQAMALTSGEMDSTLAMTSSSAASTPSSAPNLRRAVRLPGIGATDKKRHVKVLPSQRKKQAAERRAAKVS